MDRLTDTTRFIDVKTDIRDRISVEVGDSKEAAFMPQTKVMRWDNEVNLSVRLVHDETRVTVEEVDGLVKWRGERREAHFYELPTSELLPEGGTEVEILLLERPPTNVVRFTLNTKGLAFYEQPALTQAEIDEGVTRPPHVVGSYAVYADTQKTNYTDGKLYRTGKVGHIYRPWIVDANGRGGWGNLNIDTVRGLLTVRIPQAFLDSAAYPVRHAAGLTFGYTTAPATATHAIVNRAYTAKGTPASAGEVSKITCYIGGAEAANFKGILWLGSDLSVFAASSGVSTPGAKAWTDATLVTSITAVDYHIGLITDTSVTGGASYDTGSAGSGILDTSNPYAAPETLVAAANNRMHGAYATYTGSGQIPYRHSLQAILAR